MKSGSKNPLVSKISICGQVAEHKSEMAQLHGGDEDDILAVLSDAEKEQLDAILSKLQAAWMEGHRAHHAKAAQQSAE